MHPNRAMDLNSVLAGFLLFWPLCLLMFGIGFAIVAFAVVLVCGAATLFGIFLYGLYSLLRDLGLLSVVFQKLGNLKTYISERIQEHVRKSFQFSQLGSLDEKPKLFVCHPHGLYGLTWFIHFSAGLSDWPLKKRPVLAVHSFFFKIPLLRELFQHHNCIEATEAEIKRCLQEGTSVALLVGGIEELLLTQSGSLNLVLKKREGFLRIARDMKVPLVPLVSPAENDLFELLDLPWIGSLSQFLYKHFHLAFPIPSFQSLRNWMRLTVNPFSKPVLTYILEPVGPDASSLEEHKSVYINQLQTFSKEFQIPIQFQA